jgi:catechol 2,3-dioxygenase-like lactoylglutathione lyase family enzyme
MTLRVDRRSFLLSVPAVLAAHRLMAQGTAPQIRVNGLSQLTLTVSDTKRSIDFYQGLFGMPIQARQGTTTFLRIGAGPRFLAIVPAGPGERPSISRFGMGIEQFNVDSVLKILAQHGVTPEDSANATSPRVAPMKVRVVTRGNTREMFVGDPAGIVFQLHDVSYCGGTGPLGHMCQPEPAPKKGLLALKDMSHFTIGASSAQFYPQVFGMPVQAMQATTPAYGVGPGVHFLMFTGGGGGRGAAPGGTAPAGGAAPAVGAGGGAGAAAGRGGGAAGRGGAPATPNIDHACMSLDNFVPEAVTKALTDYGLKPGARSDGALVTYISLRMENRGGAPVTGTPELYFTDPDGLAIQLQDTKYCGGGGYLGDVCPG